MRNALFRKGRMRKTYGPIILAVNDQRWSCNPTEIPTMVTNIMQKSRS